MSDSSIRNYVPSRRLHVRSLFRPSARPFAGNPDKNSPESITGMYCRSQEFTLTAPVAPQIPRRRLAVELAGKASVEESSPRCVGETGAAPATPRPRAPVSSQRGV